MNMKRVMYVFLGLYFVITAIYSGYLNYSPIPFWDMWDGYLGFYYEIYNGNWQAWFQQHNEHRYILARILFWLDIKYFGGLSYILIISNYLIIISSVVLLLKFNKLIQNEESLLRKVFIVSFLMLLIQEENLNWGFQGGFLLAAVLPLLALYLANKSLAISKSGLYYYILALIVGVLAVGTLASGILVLPLLFIFGLLTHQSASRNLTTFSLSFVCIILYYYGYTSPGNHGSLFPTFLNRPGEFIQYVLLYLGGPFYYIFGKGSFGLILSQLFGAGFLLALIMVAWVNYSKFKSSGVNDNTAILALLLFILYVLFVAAGTAGGRLIFGLEQSLSSRYMTLSLMAWAALLIVVAPVLKTGRDKLFNILLLLILLLMIPIQYSHLKVDADSLYERSVAILALKLGVNDQPQINSVYPDVNRALNLADFYISNKTSIFGISPYLDFDIDGAKYLDFNADEINECGGGIDSIDVIMNDSRFKKIEGWISEYKIGRSYEFLNVTDKSGKILGYLIVGEVELDVGQILNGDLAKFKVKGYFLDPPAGGWLYLLPNSLSCYLKVYLPLDLVSYQAPVLNEDKISSRALIGTENIVSNQWIGVDYYSFAKEGALINGFDIFGSFSGQDSNAGEKGELILKIQKGDILLYRSEPKANLQKISLLLDGVERNIPRPNTSDWVEINFVGKDLPDLFEIKLIDGGGGWGEWSAVALKNSKN